MGILARIADRMDRQSHLMDAMMDRLEVDREALAMDTCGARLEAAARSCLMCRDSEECGRWLDGKDDTAPTFCPNIQVFELHRK
ncbi:DUF6455 family protein [Oricola thermophila]|uniref:DUF6455 domain-containing protein n=1 Tax=Oricola thermophila TaxID=2742145 RepID=A0A6N1VHX1_9HYPH|nr:DUF6455 family protein [Oricola thermophila]QKV18922.1 hypothetical protein HTY61_10900 [Oricola thermophila]